MVDTVWIWLCAALRKTSREQTSMPMRLFMRLREMLRITRFLAIPSGTFSRLFNEMFSDRSLLTSWPLPSLLFIEDAKLL